MGKNSDYDPDDNKSHLAFTQNSTNMMVNYGSAPRFDERS